MNRMKNNSKITSDILEYEFEDANLSNIGNATVVSEYFQWQLRHFLPFLSGRILEIGSGIGSISQLLLKYSDFLMVSDISKHCLTITKEKLRANNFDSQLDFAQYALGEPVPDSFIRSPFDAAVCVNVLEHVKDDVAALQYLSSALKKEGRILVLVPALEMLYGSVDKVLGHYRRYNRHTLGCSLNASGYKIETMQYINFLGIFGWWFNARLLKRKVIPKSNFVFFRLLFPMVKAFECCVRPPIGLSIIAIAKKD